MLRWGRLLAALLCCTLPLGACSDRPVLALAEGPVLSPRGDAVYRIGYTELGNGAERLEVCTPDLRRCSVVVQTTNQSTIAARWMPRHPKWQFSQLEVALDGPIVRGRTTRTVAPLYAYITQCPICGSPPCTERALSLIKGAQIQRGRAPIEINKARDC